MTAVVRALVLRTGHSVADPVPDDDITRLVESLVYIGADEDDIYRVRAAMREAGRSLVEHC